MAVGEGREHRGTWGGGNGTAGVSAELPQEHPALSPPPGHRATSKPRGSLLGAASGDEGLRRSGEGAAPAGGFPIRLCHLLPGLGRKEGRGTLLGWSQERGAWV